MQIILVIATGIIILFAILLIYRAILSFWSGFKLGKQAVVKSDRVNTENTEIPIRQLGTFTLSIPEVEKLMDVAKLEILSRLVKLELLDPNEATIFSNLNIFKLLNKQDFPTDFNQFFTDGENGESFIKLVEIQNLHFTPFGESFLDAVKNSTEIPKNIVKLINNKTDLFNKTNLSDKTIKNPNLKLIENPVKIGENEERSPDEPV